MDIIMSMNDDLRMQLIRQFPAEVVEMTEPTGEHYYACSTCKRPVTVGAEKCTHCGQALGWEHVHKEAQERGITKATLEFEVPPDFIAGDCRRCPLSYITKENKENVYECPLHMRTHCTLKLS